MTEMIGDVMDLYADFNEVYDDDYVWTSTRRTPGAHVDLLTPGEWVRLVDDDGASCLGIIHTVEGPIVTCKLDWSTWRSIIVDLHESHAVVTNPRELTA